MSILNIAIYCGSRDGLDRSVDQFIQDLGQFFKKYQHNLVYGGGNCGLMGKVANTMMDAGRSVYGVIPQFLVEREAGLTTINELTIVDDMPTRKTLMIEKSEACIVLPGGVGTLEEVSEILSMLRLDLTGRPCFIANINGFYEPLKALLDKMVEVDFMEEAVPNVHFVCSVKEIETILHG